MKITRLKVLTLMIGWFAIGFWSGAAHANPYYYTVTKVTDGDTIRVEVPWMPEELGKDIAIRIMGIDTPEKGGRASCEAEAKLGEEATEFARSVIKVGDVVGVNLISWDKYGGRIDADVIVDGQDFAQMQIERGLAKPYDGGTKESWCE